MFAFFTLRSSRDRAGLLLGHPRAAKETGGATAALSSCCFGDCVYASPTDSLAHLELLASPQDDDIARLGPLDDAQYVPRDGRHDPLVLIRIAVAVVNVGHHAGAVIGHAVHRVTAEAKPGDPRQAGAPQVVRRDALDPKLADELLQQRA